MFQGFSQDAIDFLWGIRFNNERSWFEAHKQEYLDLIAQPMKELGQQVHSQILEEFPDMGINLHVSRIYRDARRLHGRGPYKDHLWFTLRRPREDWVSTPCFYFEVAPEYYCYGVGCYDATPLTMNKLRARIDHNPKKLETLARKLNKSKFRLDGQEYKRPKGDPGELLYSWYNRKNISFHFEDNSDGVLFTPELVNEMVEGFRFLMPYYNFMDGLAGDPDPNQP